MNDLIYVSILKGSKIKYVCSVFSIIFILNTSILAESGKNIIYLYKQDYYAPLELVKYKKNENDQSDHDYLRNEFQGRFVTENELDSIITKDYFDKIVNSTRYDALFDSLLYFDRSAQYTSYKDSDEIFQKNFNHRLLKIGLLTATTYFYLLTKESANSLSTSIRYLNHHSREKRFYRNRNAYYSLGIMTIVMFAYSSYLAWTEFGNDENGNDLFIQSRQELDDASDILKSGLIPFSDDSIAYNPSASVFYSQKFSFDW